MLEDVYFSKPVQAWVYIQEITRNNLQGNEITCRQAYRK